LLSIARHIPLFTVEQQKEIIEIIIQRLDKEQDGDAKVRNLSANNAIYLLLLFFFF
jgi:hypothetical protein